MRRTSNRRPRALWSNRRFTGVLVVAALAVMVLFLVTPALGLFTVPSSAGVQKAQIFTSPTIGTPTNFDCTWSTAAANPTTVNLSWTNAQAWSTTQYERNVNGGAYTTATVPVTASTVPVTNVSTPAANQYGYRSKAVASNWISGYTSAITDENCKGAINKLIDGSVNAKLNNPHDVAVDSLGNVYIADTNNHRIRCIAATSRCGATVGNIYTYAGTGSSGTTDAATKGTAQVNGPKGVWIDQYDNLLISDTGNGAIRIVRMSGNSSPTTLYGKALTNVDYMYTIAGNLGTSGYAGDTLSALNAATRLNAPQDIVTDSSDNLYIADTANNRVRCVAATAKCGATGGFIYTYAGTGTSGYVSDGQAATNANSRIAAPTGLGMNAGGSLIIGDKNNSRIRMVYWSGEAYGLGSLTQTFMYTLTTSANNPWGVVVDSSDNVLWGDSGGSLVKTFFASTSTRYGITTPTDNAVYTIAGNGSGAYNGTGLPPTGVGSVNISSPYGIAIDPTAPTQVYSVDNGRGVLRKIDYSNGYVFTWAGISGTSTYVADDVPAHGWEYVSMQHSSIDSSGNIYFADSADNRIRKWIVSCACLVVAAGNGGSTSNGDGGFALAAGINAPQGVHVDSSGNLFIAETGGHKIRMVPASNMTRFNQAMTATSIYTILGNGSACAAGSAPCGDGTALGNNSHRVNAPRDVLTDSLGNLIVSDTTNCEIRLVANATTARFGLGTLTVNNIYRVGGTQLSCGNGGDGSPATQAGATLNSPDGITLDGSNNLYIADSGGARIRSISSSGTLNTFVGTGVCGSTDGSTASATICGARDVSYESSTGAISIADTGNDLVRKVLSSNVTTIAGGGATTTGDTGPGRGAVLVDPVGVAAKPSGDIYVTQNGTNVDMRSIKGPA